MTTFHPERLLPQLGAIVLMIAVFFILEEDADGNDVFDLVGRIQPVPLPPALVLFAGASAVMLRRVRTRRRNR